MATSTSERPKVPRRTAWIIWGLAILLTCLVLGLAASLALHAWHIRQVDDQWCTFYSSMSRLKLEDPVLHAELVKLRTAAHCG